MTQAVEHADFSNSTSLKGELQPRSNKASGEVAGSSASALLASPTLARANLALSGEFWRRRVVDLFSCNRRIDADISDRQGFSVPPRGLSLYTQLVVLALRPSTAPGST